MPAPNTHPQTQPRPHRALFRARHRLSNDNDYKAVFNAKTRKHAGPLTIFAKPNNLDHHRLGLSIGKRVGNAVTRNLLKRKLREAFRHTAPNIQSAYDFVITARPHDTRPTADYTNLFADCARRLHNAWQRRATNEDTTQERIHNT